MFTVLTTANFPDVALFAYKNNYFSMFFFITFILVGIYILINILLASVFSKFTLRLEARIRANGMKRRKHITQIVSKFEQNRVGFLQPDELNNLLFFVYDLDPNDESSQR